MNHASTSSTSFAIKIEKHLLKDDLRLAKPSLDEAIAFGKRHSSHMLVCDYLHDKGGWQNAQIVPFAPFSMEPDSVALHYGQQIFEGLKAYRQADGKSVALFRPEQNAKRFFHSAERLGMQPVDPEFFVRAIKELVQIDQEFVLPSPGSLYIRPGLIPLDRGVSYRAAKDYRFFVILSAAKQYFGLEQTVKVYVEQEMVRAFRGGTGDSKAGANYAPALLALNRAKKMGADSVLWLDALEHKYLEEIGAMNVMLVYEDCIITPPLTGTILPGVTRASIIQLARHQGFKVVEEKITIEQVIADIKSGKLKEAFGCGTAAVVSPIGSLLYQGEELFINDNKAGPISLKLKKAIMDIQNGLSDDIFHWLVKVC